MICEDKSPCHRGDTSEKWPRVQVASFLGSSEPTQVPRCGSPAEQELQGELLLPYTVLAAVGTAVPSVSHKDVEALNLLLFAAARAAAPLSAWFP